MTDPDLNKIASELRTANGALAKIANALEAIQRELERQGREKK